MNIRKSHWPVFNVGVRTRVQGRVVLCGFNIRSLLGHLSACLGISEKKEQCKMLLCLQGGRNSCRDLFVFSLR
jgi:hypothetical protein